jgi:nicotinamide phosphoribosyltransferase
MYIVDELLSHHPTGILSVVADSYSIYDFVKAIGGEERLSTRIKHRDGVFVVRPDSTTNEHPTPDLLTEWIVGQLDHDFGSTTNSKGFKVLNPKVRVLWGDGIDPHGIEKILARLQLEGYSAENMVFGMGGGLLQKVNRDTQRFAHKMSAICRGNKWYDVQKRPLDPTKWSKAGKLRLAQDTLGGYETMRQDEADHDHIIEHDILETVFEDGEIVRTYTFDEIRERAALTAKVFPDPLTGAPDVLYCS